MFQAIWITEVWIKSDMMTLKETLLAVRLKFFGYIEANKQADAVTISCAVSHLSIFLQYVYNSGHS